MEYIILFDQKSSEEIFKSKLKPFQVHNNCAGKHLAMLSSCLVNNYPIENYLDFDHPHQNNIRKIFHKFTEIKLKKKIMVLMVAVRHNMLLNQRSGKALKNLLNSYNGNFEYSKNIK